MTTTVVLATTMTTIGKNLGVPFDSKRRIIGIWEAGVATISITKATVVATAARVA